jgi:hypothetical protein
MKRLAGRIFPLFLTILLLSFLLDRLQIAFSAPEADSIAKILARSVAYCEKVFSAALYFVCEERIREDIFATPERFRRGLFQFIRPHEKNEYVYDYQLIKKEGRVEESRTLIEENGEKKKENNSPLETKRFISLKTVYAPADFLGREAQTLYAYEWLGEERVLGRKSYLLKSKPKENPETKRAYGNIWVDKEDGAVLKIERASESIEGFEELNAQAAKRGLRPVLSAIHEFGVERNGIRFPSRTEYKESYAGNLIPKFDYSRATVEYGHYRFFVVEVKVERK